MIFVVYGFKSVVLQFKNHDHWYAEKYKLIII